MIEITADLENNHQHSVFVKNLFQIETHAYGCRMTGQHVKSFLISKTIPKELEWFLQSSVNFDEYHRERVWFGSGTADPKWPGIAALNVHYIDGTFSVQNPGGVELFLHEAGHALDLLLRDKTEKLRFEDFGLKPTLLDNINHHEAVEKAPSMKWITMTVCHELRAIALSEKLRSAIAGSFDEKYVDKSDYGNYCDNTTIIKTTSRMRAHASDWNITRQARRTLPIKHNKENKALRKAIASHGYCVFKSRFTNLIQLTDDQLAVLATSLQLLNQQYHISDKEFYAKFFEYAVPSILAAWSQWDHIDVKDAWNKLCVIFSDIKKKKADEKIAKQMQILAEAEKDEHDLEVYFKTFVSPSKAIEKIEGIEPPPFKHAKLKILKCRTFGPLNSKHMDLPSHFDFAGFKDVFDKQLDKTFKEIFVLDDVEPRGTSHSLPLLEELYPTKFNRLTFTEAVRKLKEELELATA